LIEVAATGWVAGGSSARATV